MVTKEINVKNISYYFWNDQIWINNFDAKNIKLDKKSVMDINIYYIGYVTKKAEYNIDSVNPLHLNIKELDGFINEKNGNKYLNISLTDSNNDDLIKYAEEDYMKIKFDSDDNLPLNKVLKFHALTIIIRSVFERDGNISRCCFSRLIKTKFKMKINLKIKM